MENCFTFSDEELGALADYDEIGYEPEYYLMDGSKSTALTNPRL
jgi:hypothetical protein